MIHCRITPTTDEGVTSYTGLFANTMRAAFDAVRRFGATSGKVRVEPA